jgi:hypothetical protein
MNFTRRLNPEGSRIPTRWSTMHQIRFLVHPVGSSISFLDLSSPPPTIGRSQPSPTIKLAEIFPRTKIYLKKSFFELQIGFGDLQYFFEFYSPPTKKNTTKRSYSGGIGAKRVLSFLVVLSKFFSYFSARSVEFVFSKLKKHWSSSDLD